MINKKIIFIILVGIIVLGTVVFGVSALLKKKNNIISNVNKNGSVSVSQQAVLQASAYKKMSEIDKQLDAKRQIDKDLDSLSDEEEKQLGTNPESIDTDGDGLLDGDEVKIYRTNPLKADTDSDGFKDGLELRAGYNPLGAGKIKK
jgi:hypothetical protein